MFSIPIIRVRLRPSAEERLHACPPLHPRRRALAPRLPRCVPRAAGGQSGSGPPRPSSSARAGVWRGRSVCRQPRRPAERRYWSGSSGTRPPSRSVGVATVTSRTVSVRNMRHLARSRCILVSVAPTLRSRPIVPRALSHSHAQSHAPVTLTITLTRKGPRRQEGRSRRSSWRRSRPRARRAVNSLTSLSIGHLQSDLIIHPSVTYSLTSPSIHRSPTV